MLKVLWYSDFLCPTGFGNVAEEIISRLQEKYDITVLGVNYYGEPYNIPGHPYYRFKDIPVYPAYIGGDYLGRQNLLNLLKEEDFDILFSLQDTFNMVPLEKQLHAAQEDKQFKHIFYFPVDGDFDPEWVQTAYSADYPVTYTKYGQQKIKEHGDVHIPYIYHGVDTEVFYPLSETERVVCRSNFMRAGPEDFVITNVNRNQPRKDLPRTILAFIEIKKQISEAKLYLHTNVKDPAGHNLEKFIKRYVPQEFQNSIIVPNPDQLGKYGVSKKTMRQIYGCSDVVISTSRGEGWGLSTIEAMACKVPVVMPRHTSLVEIVGEDEERGFLAECTDVDVNVQDNERIRPVVDIDELVEKVTDVHAWPEVSQIRTEKAYAWVHEHCDWDKITKQWEEVFDE